MPPPPTPTSLPRIETWTSSGFGLLFKTVLLLSILVSVVRLIVAACSRGKRRMASPSPSAEKDPLPPTPEKDPNQYLESLKQESLRPDLGPIYPWIAPPKQLPGPYDAPYYPLPLPTLRKQSHEPASEEPEEMAVTSSTRRVSTNSVPAQDHVVERSTTISSHGWRRTHWNVSAG